MSGTAKSVPAQGSAMVAVGVVMLCVAGAGCRTHDAPPPLPAAAASPGESDQQRVVAFCSACHVMPPADSFPRDAWHHEVMQGYTFYARSGRNDLDPPAPHLALAYFRERAPEKLTLPAFPEDSLAGTRRFLEETIARADLPIPPAVAHVRLAEPTDAHRLRFFAADMRLGYVQQLTRQDDHWNTQIIARLDNPCHVEPCDVNGDGRQDLLVADLGSFDPDDHRQGRVVWLRGDDAEGWVAEIILQDVGRVADVRPADFDADGLLDVLVAEFGWHETGGIWWLRQTRNEAGEIHFDAHKISSLSGTIHVPVHDFDGDGRPDFAALISQQYERIDVVLNRGGGDWRTHTIWSAPDPAYGVSGISLHDLDQDGDMDVLCTNGDTFDSLSIKPSHGIQWLENKGDLQFEYHRLFDLPGAYCARAADLDGDEDLDIVAGVWLPRQMIGDLDVQALPTLLWWEQTAPTEFRPHVLERGAPYHTALELADVDHDDDWDIVVGGHLSNLGQWPHWGSVWRNVPRD